MKGPGHPPKWVKDLLSDDCLDPKVLKSDENCQKIMIPIPENQGNDSITTENQVN